MKDKITNFWEYLDREIANYKSLLALNFDSRWPIDIQRLVTYIHTHLFDEGLTVFEIKRKCKVHDNNISGRFAYYLGRSIKSYINFHRINMAKRLLRYNGIKVVQVALAVGYNSHGVFTRAFQRHVGCTPHEFQKKYNKNVKKNRKR